ncbi:hypothetical protein ACIPZ5_17735 [Pseudomonas sp. NPDC089428]|uniref:hypothetical protein n=1 Tax=Pseudomonas sp. NPDC089428 TaxID=3364467 RepID=UPI00381F1828
MIAQTVDYMANAIKSLKMNEIVGALAHLLTETKEERAGRKESLLYALLKSKEVV